MTTWELQQQLHSAVKKKFRLGMSENDVAQILTGVCPNWQGDLISGARSADVEGGPTERIIENGDILLLDLQVYSENMWSDLTRVYFIGEVSEKQKKAYEDVVKAISAGEKLLCHDTKVKDIWTCMRDVIGSEFAFTHHGGHLIDSEHFYLKPSFVPESEDVLNAGMTVTLEPAVYYPGEFGIRLENNYRITGNGFERLCSLSMEMSDYILKG